MADLKSLEHPTLKVPYELLNKKYRAALKGIDLKVSHVRSAALELEKGLAAETVKAGDISRLLGGVAEHLSVMKRKAEESISEELQAGYVCKRRLEHLREHATGGSQWRRSRLDRMLVEYFLRKGYYGTATRLADTSNLTNLTNIDVFLASREVEQSLAERETSKCLAWCQDNRSKLRKLKSTMEFNLRIQEYVELVRADKRVDAVRHARKHFSNFEDDQLQDVQHCMALLAFPTNTELSPYKEFLDEKRWDRLIEQFRHEYYRLFHMSNQSVFTVTLEAGLSALKTPQCYRGTKERRNPSCPVCNESFNVLASSLPMAHCSQSRLFCSISGLPLNEHNQPMMLPNGHVYGEQALQQMAADNNGNVICPKTKESFPYKKVEKVFVM
ncbi:E3 ubiquitin-protein transferase MAEA [Frankliniella occidentalis]|uniref:E3 ubiquitin-protein transferase MAEA n=1 Tax=Frankliniella occidentalis TaxID=133901 RepID=A0A6J1TMB6_FRAOC|nr:E3 ubiquitin-protein transferase MAEA [Frankliniella occidentalis]